MAENENSAPARTGLPEKEWFTLSEIAERWGCSEDDLLHYGETEKLGLSFNFQDVKLAWGSNDIHFDDGEIYIQETDVKRWRGLFMLSKHDIRGIVAYGSLYPQELHNTLTLDHCYQKYGRVEHGDGQYKDSFGPHVDYVQKSDLLITRQERDRFEKKYRIGAHAGEMPDLSKPDKLDQRKEKTYLQVIRALAIEAGYSLETPYKDADTLMKSAASHGVIMPSKRDTIAHVLKDAANLSD